MWRGQLTRGENVVTEGTAWSAQHNQHMFEQCDFDPWQSTGTKLVCERRQPRSSLPQDMIRIELLILSNDIKEI